MRGHLFTEEKVMDISLRYCIALASAAKPWFDLKNDSAFLDGLGILLDMSLGLPVDSEIALQVAMKMESLAPDMDCADSDLDSIALNCCAAISSAIKSRLGLPDEDEAQQLFIDAVDLAACVNDESNEDLTTEELLGLPEVSSALNSIPEDLSKDVLPVVLANYPPWMRWLHELKSDGN